MERSGGLAIKCKKNVSFFEDEDLSRVFVSTHEPYSSGDEEEKLVEDLRRRVQKFDVISNENVNDDQGDNQEAYSDDEESSQISIGEENLKRGLRAEGSYEGDDVDFVFSAPMPVKMESRADLTKTQKGLEIIKLKARLDRIIVILIIVSLLFVLIE